MYFRAKIDVDPRSVVHREYAPPTDVFGKLLHYLTAKRTGEELEVESFTRVSILQQLLGALQSVGVRDVIRLAVDGVDLYYDSSRTRDDLEAAVGGYIERKQALPPGSVFETLRLVVEHLAEGVRYVIEVRVQRTHAPGEDPISLRINAVVAELGLGFQETVGQLRDRLAPVFETSAGYAAYVEDKRTAFGAFVRGLENSVCAAMAVDSVQRVDQVCLLRPFGALQRLADLPSGRGNVDSDPLFFGYPGIDRAFAYAWLWAEACHRGALQVSRCRVVDERGRPVADIGSTAVDAANHPLFVLGAALPEELGEDITRFEGHTYAAGPSGSG